MTEEKRYGTALTYRKARSSFRQFLYAHKYGTASGGVEDIPLDRIDGELVRCYNRYLWERGVVRNTISFYNRVLRAMYHKGVREHHYPDLNPFAGVYTGIDRTVGSAVSERSVALLATLDVGDDRSLALARDMFLFSYAMRGMPFVDMAYLRKSQIRDGILTYVRRKTGRTIHVRVEGGVQNLIDKYSKQGEGSEYVFPILGLVSRDSEETYAKYRSGLAIYNRKLKRLATMSGITAKLTSHVARHSWVAAARSIGSGVSVISEALGHSSERMTRIYMGSLNTIIIDDTNRKLLDRLNRYYVDEISHHLEKTRECAGRKRENHLRKRFMAEFSDWNPACCLYERDEPYWK